MPISLTKGQKISLEKAAKDSGVAGGISKIMVGLGWDTARYDGGEAFDLDSSVFLCRADGKVLNDSSFVFYGNLTSDGVQHLGDNLTGEGDGDDEVIKVDLTALNPSVEKLAVAVTIYESDKRHQNFGMVENSYIRVVDEASGTELLRYDLGEDYSVETAVIVAELYKKDGEWRFNAIGSGFSGGLAALCNNYGVAVG